MIDPVVTAWLLFILILLVVGLVSDNHRLRKRNKVLDESGALLAEDYLRLRYKLVALCTLDPASQEFDTQRDISMRIIRARSVLGPRPTKRR